MEAFLLSFLPPNTICKSQTSSSAASRLPAACSPFRTLTHSNHQLILLHLIFMRVSAFLSSPISISHNTSTLQSFCHCTFVTYIHYIKLPNTKLAISIHWDFGFLSWTERLVIWKKTFVAKVLFDEQRDFAVWTIRGRSQGGIPAGGLTHHGPPLDKRLFSVLNRLLIQILPVWQNKRPLFPSPTTAGCTRAQWVLKATQHACSLSARASPPPLVLLWWRK